MFRSLFSACALLAHSWTTFAQYPLPLPCEGTCQDTHDPALIQRTDGTWYRFATSNGISIYTAPEASGPWSYQGAVLPDCSVINLPGNCDIWAADVTLVGNYYYLYYSVSTLESQTSAIGVATSEVLDAGSWFDHGSVIQSTPGLPYNTIDPNLLVLPDGRPLLTFGSYWDGIFQTELNSDLPSGPLSTLANAPINHLAMNVTWPHYIEGAYLYPSNGYYYLFFSSGLCCGYDNALPPPGEEYKIMVCRSESPSGFFTDANGVDCLQSGGTEILASHDFVYGPGGQSVYDVPGVGPVLVYHYADTRVGLADREKFFGINYLDFSSGWPVVV